MTKLGNNIKQIRTQQKLTQTQLANRAGTTKNTISSIETGQFSPTAFLAYKLCKALNCKFEEAFYIEEKED